MDSRRLILLVMFSFSLFMLWDSWKRYNQPKPTETVAASSVIEAPEAFISTPLGNQGQPTHFAPAAPDFTQAPTGESILIETDLFIAEISTIGGDIIGLQLKGHYSQVDATKPFMLFSSDHQYRAQTGLTAATEIALPNHNTLYTALPGKRFLEDSDKELQLRLQAPKKEGINVNKILTFTRDSYVIRTSYEISNNSGNTISPSAYFQLRRDSRPPAGGSWLIRTFTGAALFTQDSKFEKISFSDIDKGKFDLAARNVDGWIGMIQHYFAAAWIPAPEMLRKFYVRRIEDRGSVLYDAGVIVPVDQVAPGATATVSMSLFAGPQFQHILKQLAKPIADGGIGATGLPLVVDYGWLTILAAPIFWMLDTINGFIGNWGWSIIVLTIIIKALFHPLSVAGYKSMARMRAFAPRLNAMRERYGNDKQRMNQEMMHLYKTEKINPLGGCFPILLQIPVFIALYWALLGAVEMRGAPWMGWIQDLSAQDPYYILPTIMVATMWAQNQLNPTPPDPMQAKVMMIMPFAFGVLFFFFPAGLVLYWVVNNVLSIAQQWHINRAIDREVNRGKAANDE